MHALLTNESPEWCLVLIGGIQYRLKATGVPKLRRRQSGPEKAVRSPQKKRRMPRRLLRTAAFSTVAHPRDARGCVNSAQHKPGNMRAAHPSAIPPLAWPKRRGAIHAPQGPTRRETASSAVLLRRSTTAEAACAYEAAPAAGSGFLGLEGGAPAGLCGFGANTSTVTAPTATTIRPA